MGNCVSNTKKDKYKKCGDNEPTIQTSIDKCKTFREKIKDQKSSEINYLKCELLKIIDGVSNDDIEKQMLVEIDKSYNSHSFSTILKHSSKVDPGIWNKEVGIFNNYMYKIEKEIKSKWKKYHGDIAVKFKQLEYFYNDETLRIEIEISWDI